MLTDYALALSKTLTSGSGDHGDIKLWNPDLGTVAGHGSESESSSTTALDGGGTGTVTHSHSAHPTSYGQQRSREERADNSTHSRLTSHGQLSREGRSDKMAGLHPPKEEPSDKMADAEAEIDIDIAEDTGWRKFVKYFTPS